MISNFIDFLYEKTVFPSFSRIGYKTRRRLFNWAPLTEYTLDDQVVVLTGGTSGIGKSAAAFYAQLGAHLIMIGRDSAKTQQVVDELSARFPEARVEFVIGDLGHQPDVHTLAEEIQKRVNHIDILVHNAGALFNTRKRAANDTDLSVELMVSTPFLLTGLLLPQLLHNKHSDTSARQIPARVLTMSSGGMYTEPLDVSQLEMSDDDYQGAKQYARAKRAQVVLNELWARHLADQAIVFHALHPGWVYTPGIVEALPGFSKLLRPLGLLRTAEEGADTLIWLSADQDVTQHNGKFWHDRAQRPIDMTKTTRQADTFAEREKLWQWCEDQVGWQLRSE